MLVYMALIDDPKRRILFEEIFYHYRASMLALAQTILGDHHWAEDAVSEAFLKIAKNMETISAIPPQERVSYLVILTRNSALDLYRQRQRVPSSNS